MLHSLLSNFWHRFQLLWSGSAAYLPPLLTSVIATFALAKDWKNHAASWRRYSVLVLIVLSYAVTVVGTWGARTQNSKDKQTLHDANEQLNTKIDGLNSQIQESQRQQELVSKTYLDSIGHLSDRVADLQSKAQTADLQQEANALRQDLRDTQKAVAPTPKADIHLLIGGVTGNLFKPSKESVKLPLVDNRVMIALAFNNDSDSDALDGDEILWFCESCVLAKEVPGWMHLDGAPIMQRNSSFQHILAHSQTPQSTFDVVPPPFAKEMDIGFSFRCRTCVASDTHVVHIVFSKP